MARNNKSRDRRVRTPSRVEAPRPDHQRRAPRERPRPLAAAEQARLERIIEDRRQQAALQGSRESLIAQGVISPLRPGTRAYRIASVGMRIDQLPDQLRNQVPPREINSELARERFAKTLVPAGWDMEPLLKEAAYALRKLSQPR